jgi:hypothetical protein
MPWWQIQDLMWTAAGIIAVLIAVTGVTLRFAIKPFLRDLAELRNRRQEEIGSPSDRRLDRMERQIDHLDATVTKLLEAADFDRQLKAGRPPSKTED